MKKIMILIAAVFAGVTSFAQDVNDGNRMIVHQKNGEVKAFACNGVDSVNFAKVGDITPEVVVKEALSREAIFSVKFMEGCSACDLAVIEKSKENTAADVFEYVSLNKVNTITESGDVKIMNLLASTDYVLYTVAKDAWGISSAFARTEFSTVVGEEDFVLNVTELTSGHINLDIIPRDKTLKYTYTLLPKKKYEEAVNFNGSIFLYDIAWWEFMAEQYGKSDWRDIMKQLLTVGDKTFYSTEEYGFMDWDTDHVFYCYGIDDKGDPSTPLYTKEFRSPKPVASDNKITVTVKEVKHNGCWVEVNTTNDDLYVICAQRQDFVDYWEAQGTEEEMIRVLYADCEFNEEWCAYRHYGSDEFFVKANKADTDYVLIIMGSNEGPSTEVQYIKFHTAKN